MSCGQGALQTRGTCWFYSILNGFMLAEDGHKILYSQLAPYYKSLSAADKEFFDDSMDAPCPLGDGAKGKKLYFWKFIDKYMCFMSGARSLSAQAGMSANLLANIKLAGTLGNGEKGSKGASPQLEIGPILRHIGFQGKFSSVHYGTPKLPKNPDNLFSVVMHSPGTRYYMSEIPSQFMDDHNYSLMSASIIIGNTKSKTASLHKVHAITGYVCNGTGYIFDSNQMSSWKCNWWDLTQLKKCVYAHVAPIYPFFARGQIDMWSYAFVVFSNKKAIANISPACRLKRKNVPAAFNRYGITNINNPNILANLNSTKYAHIPPARRLALKKAVVRAGVGSMLLSKNVLLRLILGAQNKNSARWALANLQNAGYTINKEGSDYFNAKLAEQPSPNNNNANLFERAKRILEGARTKTERKKLYMTTGWKRMSMNQRKILSTYRDTGVWTNATSPSPPKPKPNSPSPPKPKPNSPSPRTKRLIDVKANFEAYWKALQPENRAVLRNYIRNYKSPSPVKSPLRNARLTVNALKTAKGRQEYLRTRAVNLNLENWKQLKVYIKAKNREDQNRRAQKRALKG